MTPEVHPTRWDLFRLLCKVLGGQDTHALKECDATGKFPQLVDMAQSQEMLPALAVRCNEQLKDKRLTISPENQLLTQALRDNTVRNMQITAQAIKLTRHLNKAGITPLFLKGTAQLLTASTENIGFRKQIDIDLLVAPEHMEDAANVFLNDGYSFYQFSSDPSQQPTKILNTKTAIKQSASHHHLPPLAKAGYATTVELHRHFLPKRFQHNIPLEPLLNTAIPMEYHGANFLVPTTEYQIIHLILGKLVHDGHLARRTMPLREACDYIYLINNARENINTSLVKKHCGKNYTLFANLASELMGTTPTAPNYKRKKIEKRIQIIQKRFGSPTLCTLLDTYARALHLSYSLAYSPAKLPTYLFRFRKP